LWHAIIKYVFFFRCRPKLVLKMGLELLVVGRKLRAHLLYLPCWQRLSLP
jgi:hypothetical protein